MVYTAYKPKTHDIEKVAIELEYHESDFTGTFLKEGEENYDFFQLIRHAYIGAHHEHSYKITSKQLEIMLPWVEQLHQQVKIFCVIRIESME